MRALASAIIVAAVLAPLACTIERDVLTEQITTCAAALAGQNGQACAFDGTCVDKDAADPMCCTDSAYCRQSTLVVSHVCNSDCSPCTDDRQCQRGAAICNGTVCEPCPTDPCGVCPLGWVYLQRNGCQTCECAPPSTCVSPTGTTACAAAMCYPGADCAAGCVPNSPGCCSDQCAAPGCPGPIPVGCLATCTPQLTAVGCSTCATDHCTCTLGVWHCSVVCANGHHASCIAPSM